MGDQQSRTVSSQESRTPAGYDWLLRPLNTLVSGYTRAGELKAAEDKAAWDADPENKDKVYQAPQFYPHLAVNPTTNDVAMRLNAASLNPLGSARVLEGMRNVALGDWTDPNSATNQGVFNSWQAQAQKTVGQGINEAAARMTKAGQNASSSAFGQLSRQAIGDANTTLLGKLADYQQAARDQQLKAAGGVTSFDVMPYEAAVKATQGTNSGSAQVSNVSGANPLFGSK